MSTLYARVDVYRQRGVRRRWRYRVVGANGEPLAASQAYASKEDAVRGAHDLVAAITRAKSSGNLRVREVAQ